ncbi:MAG: hypothetical protein V4719_04300, partial [Planctomycetota bacterium]
VRKLTSSEINSALAMLSERIGANYQKIHTLAGTWDVVDEYWGASVAQGKEQLRKLRAGKIDASQLRANQTRAHFVTNAVAKIWIRKAGEGNDEIRSDYAESEPTTEHDAVTEKVVEVHRKDESKTIRTPEYFIRFPLTETRVDIPGFPTVSGFDAGQAGRIIYKEDRTSADSKEQFTQYINPLLFFSNGSLRYDELCKLYLDSLNGKRTPEEKVAAEGNLEMEVVNRNGEEFYRMTIWYSNRSRKTVTEFASQSGFNAVSFVKTNNNRSDRERFVKYSLVDGVYLPNESRVVVYHLKENGSELQLRRSFVAKAVAINSDISDDLFTVENLGVRYGDRLVDRLTNALLIYDGKAFVPAVGFKLDPTRMDSGKVKRANRKSPIHSESGSMRWWIVVINGVFILLFIVFWVRRKGSSQR